MTRAKRSLSRFSRPAAGAAMRRQSTTIQKLVFSWKFQTGSRHLTHVRGHSDCSTRQLNAAYSELGSKLLIPRWCCARRKHFGTHFGQVLGNRGSSLRDGEERSATKKNAHRSKDIECTHHGRHRLHLRSIHLHPHPHPHLRQQRHPFCA